LKNKTTYILVGSVVFSYKTGLEWKIAKKLLSPLDTLITSKAYKNMIFEIFILLLAPYPGLENNYYNETYKDKNVSIKIKVNIVLLFFAMLFRIYLFLRCSLTFSKHFDARS
jgi:hypothetical protein